jgi:hypothetical protein
MSGLTDFITESLWCGVFTIWFVLIDDTYKALERELGHWRHAGPPPRFTDSEVITLALIIDTYFDGDEECGLSFVRQYHADLFPHLLPNGQFNYRRRLLCRITDRIRRRLIHDYGLIAPDDRLRLLDSAPLPVCTYTRGRDNQTLIGQEFFGICSSKGTKFYGLRLQLTTTCDMVVDEWFLLPASVHDSQAVPVMTANAAALDIYADGAYNNPLAMEVIGPRQGVRVFAVPRRDSRTPWPAELRRRVTKTRRRIETALSVLNKVFHIEQLRARSLDGIVSRVATRLLAHTLCFITPPLLAKLRG